jgi:hypothetical protein
MADKIDATASSPNVRWWLGAAIAAVVAVPLLMPLPNEYRAAWTSKLYDLGHVVLFAAAAWLCGRFRVARPAAIALVLVLLAAGCEAAQAVSGRDVNVGDFFRSVLGIALGFVWMRDAWKLVPATRKPLRRWAYRLCATALIVAWPIADAVPVLADAVGQYRSFPTIAAFDRPFADVSWYCEGAALERVHARNPEQWVGRLESLNGAPHPPSAILFPVVHDWRGYRRVCWEFEFEGEPLSILISVRDGRRAASGKKRFDSVETYSAGRHTRCFDLEALARGDEFAPVDLSRIQSLHFVVLGADGPRSVDLVRVYLE